jgi:2-dehydro-3-deoxyphosphogluconate aldolase/(4S)-4-hydroxy-2-oxoglutarate aldolase
VTDVQGHAVRDAVFAGRLLPVVVLSEPDGAAPLGAALLAGGLRCAEVTFRTAAAVAAIRAMAAGNPELIVGAGTVLTADQVDLALDAGARFVVSPGFGPAVVRRCLERGVPVFPGVATATEVQMAIEAGLEVVKFFPAEAAGGVRMIEALAAPFPNLRFIPTGGIGPDNLARYLAIPSVAAVGGTWMVAPSLVASADWASITRLTRDAVAAAASPPA